MAIIYAPTSYCIATVYVYSLHGDDTTVGWTSVGIALFGFLFPFSPISFCQFFFFCSTPPSMHLCFLIQWSALFRAPTPWHGMAGSDYLLGWHDSD